MHPTNMHVSIHHQNTHTEADVTSKLENQTMKTYYIQTSLHLAKIKQ